MSAMAAADRRGRTRIALLGGGFAGAGVAAHLLRLTRRPVEIAVVEPRRALGAGLAYGGDDPAHRINVPTDKMTVFADDPAHLTRWMEATGRRAADPEGETAEGWHYCRRADFGAYVGHVLAEALAAAPKGAALRHLRASALSATPQSGSVAVRLDDGTSVEADEAVVAVSHETPGASLQGRSVSGRPSGLRRRSLGRPPHRRHPARRPGGDPWDGPDHGGRGLRPARARRLRPDPRSVPAGAASPRPWPLRAGRGCARRSPAPPHRARPAAAGPVPCFGPGGRSLQRAGSEGSSAAAL
jgi:hypothetical protein